MSNSKTYGDFRVESLHDEKVKNSGAIVYFLICTTFGASIEMGFYFELIKQKICY